MGITAVLTAFILVNGAVAALLPMIVVPSVRLGRKPAQLLMPMALAAHAGSLLVLTGSPVNILILEGPWSRRAAASGSSNSSWSDCLAECGLQTANASIPLVTGVISATMRTCRSSSSRRGQGSRVSSRPWTMDSGRSARSMPGPRTTCMPCTWKRSSRSGKSTVSGSASNRISPTCIPLPECSSPDRPRISP
ncbi:SLC13 family permease [Paeniglutamicibacter cryotolerans]